jgi:hypothetical protein
MRSAELLVVSSALLAPRKMEVFLMRGNRVSTCQTCRKKFLHFKSRKRRFCSWACRLQHFGSIQDRFWKNIQKTPTCWNWIGDIRTNGYGRLNVHGRSISVHRFSWKLHFGEIPAGLFVCHHCDRKICVRPDHLFLGTPSDNIRDAKRKGRMASGDRNGMKLHPERTARGINHGQAKLTEDEVRQIRFLYTPRIISQPFLAKLFNVNQGAIWAILKRKSWKHL